MAHMVAIRFGLGSYPPASVIYTSNSETRVISLELKYSKQLTKEQIKKFPRTYEVDRANEDEGFAKQHFLDLDESLAMSSEAKDILERLEPSKHQFIEIKIKPAKQFEHLKSYYEGNTYYLAKVCQTLQAVDIENSVLKKETLFAGTSRARENYEIHQEHKDSIILNSAITKDKHIWFNENPALFGRLFISDTLKSAWEDKLEQVILGIHCQEV